MSIRCALRGGDYRMPLTPPGMIHIWQRWRASKPAIMPPVWNAALHVYIDGIGEGVWALRLSKAGWLPVDRGGEIKKALPSFGIPFA